jgi:type IV secretory pathway VirB10-like protein
MTGAPYTNPAQPPPVTARSFLQSALSIVLVVALVIGGIWWFVRGAPSRQKASVQGEKPAQTTWKKQSVYPPHEETKVAEATPGKDTTDERLKAMDRKIDALMKRVEEWMKKKPPTTTTVATKETTKTSKVGEPFFLNNKIDLSPPGASVPLYTLGTGTFLPCQLKTALNSDASTYFVAEVSANVWDTETGRHLLVPQGSKILGNGQGETLVYGDERLKTIGLTLSLGDGRDVDLGNAPVTDQQGIGGLADRVNQHYWRLLAAVLIQGSLRAGSTALTTAASSAGGAGPGAAGLAGAASQAGNKVTGPMMNTRPTIEVDAGHRCQVILLEPLTLPAMWEGGSPMAQMTSTKATPPRRRTTP